MNTSIHVINHYYTYIIDPADYHDKMSNNSTHTDHDITGIRITTGNDEESLNVPFDIEKNKEYYLVYGLFTEEYLEHADSGQIAYVDLYQSEELAKKCIDKLNTHYDKVGMNFDESYSCTLIRDDDSTYLYHTPWMGYFESLSDIKSVVVQLI